MPNMQLHDVRLCTTENSKPVNNITMCGMCSMYVQWWRAVRRCQTRQVREDSVMRQLDCQSLGSSSLLSSSSLSSQSVSVMFHRMLTLLLRLLPADTHTTDFAGDTETTSALTATVPAEWKVAAATAITTDVQHDVSCSSHNSNTMLHVCTTTRLLAVFYIDYLLLR